MICGPHFSGVNKITKSQPPNILPFLCWTLERGPLLASLIGEISYPSNICLLSYECGPLLACLIGEIYRGLSDLGRAHPIILDHGKGHRGPTCKEFETEEDCTCPWGGDSSQNLTNRLLKTWEDSRECVVCSYGDSPFYFLAKTDSQEQKAQEASCRMSKESMNRQHI